MCAGRRLDNIWNKYKLISGNPGKPVCRMQCKICTKEIIGLVTRMEEHIEGNHLQDGIQKLQQLDWLESASQEPESETSGKSSSTSSGSTSGTGTVSQNKVTLQRIDSFIVKMSTNQKTQLVFQCAKFIYATNSAFTHVEH
ncbi:uncharacterized protein LOC111635929 [Centruroides sculpturatus]|uniref:uncharacterized protein LOC111635929 n=1 Tax=Centruroides sculpturatus TaxID=218467 RepID=UPI000C6D37FA|nr:uncharacterized protein LOC111635929 [Centruroides sculpturatus]